MAGKTGIRVRISHQRIEALVELCDEMLEEFVVRNEHQLLLKEYMRDLKDDLQAMARRNQDLYTLILSGSQATAFYQLWNSLDIRHDKYATVIIENLLEKMSALAA
jgi:hypothetical protein